MQHAVKEKGRDEVKMTVRHLSIPKQTRAANTSYEYNEIIHKDIIQGRQQKED